MWNVFQGDPILIDFECLDDDEVAVDLTDYAVGLNLVWGDDDDEREEYATSDLTIVEASGTVSLTIPWVTWEDFPLPLGKKTRVYLTLEPSGEDQFTTLLGRITVRDA
jgi:hypothetical protein